VGGELNHLESRVELKDYNQLKLINMKSENLSAVFGIIVMVIALVFIPTKDEMFNKVFGIGVGLCLTYATVALIASIKALFKKN
jgi:hypothetical protein